MAEFSPWDDTFFHNHQEMGIAQNYVLLFRDGYTKKATHPTCCLRHNTFLICRHNTLNHCLVWVVDVLFFWSPGPISAAPGETKKSPDSATHRGFIHSP